MPDLKNEFSWSKSRDSLFKECLRAYYNNHYGAWGGWNKDAPDEVRELYVMKNLSSRAAWRGIVVHDVAERAIRELVQGRNWAVGDALRESERRMEAESTISRTGRYRHGEWIDWGSRRIKANGLQEDYYGKGLGEREKRDDISSVAECIRNLYRSATFRRLQEVDKASILSVEDLESFQVEGIKVWVKLDLCVRGHDDKVVIVDWKTGSSHRVKDISLQIGIYGLFGSRRWNVEPAQILGYDVNLKLGTTRKHPIDADVLAQVSGHIKSSADRMRSLLADVAANSAEIGRFPMTDRLSTCRWCRFRRACNRE